MFMVSVVPHELSHCLSREGEAIGKPFRIISKNAGAWRCNGCSKKAVQLRRAFGTWPTSDFSLLGQEQRQSFMAAVADLSGPESVAKCTELILGKETHGEYYIDGGEFLPLSVWERRGFDITRIAEFSLPMDKRSDRVLGDTYRVKILATGNRGEASTTRTSQVKRKSVLGPLTPTLLQHPAGLGCYAHIPTPSRNPIEL
jgi:hypothetical protein